MAPSVSSRPTWIELDLEAVAGNCARVIQDTATPLMAVVKGDAYGHGAVAVGRAAVRGGASWLGVARCGEARVLRQAGLDTPVLVLGMATGEEVDEAIASGVTLTLHSGPCRWSCSPPGPGPPGGPWRCTSKWTRAWGVWGCRPRRPGPLRPASRRRPGIQVDGAVQPPGPGGGAGPRPTTGCRSDRFQRGLAALEQAALRPRWAHLANSAAAFFLPEARHDLVRVANLVVGLRIRLDLPLGPGYRPALAWKARLASCRQLPPGWGVGYGQAYVTQGEE